MRISQPEDRLRAFVKLSQGVRRCPYTENEQPEYKKDVRHFIIEASRKVDENSQYPAHERIYADKAWEILRNISDEDSAALGFEPARCRPEWLIIKVLPIPPPTVRPSVVMDSSGLEVRHNADGRGARRGKKRGAEGGG